MEEGLFRALSLIAATGSTTEKQRILEENDCADLRTFLWYTSNPFITYRVNQIDMPNSFNQVQPDITTELFYLCELLARHSTTPTEARGMIKRLLAKCTKGNATYVARLFQKDLKIGLGATLINKAYKKHIPQFKVQLALPIEKYDKKKQSMVEHWGKLKYPVIIEEKYDGMRIIAVCDGETVRYFSREGHEYDTLDFLTKQVMSLRPGTKFVLDGEVIGLTYNPNCKVAKKAHDAGKHWEFAQGLSMTKSGNQGAGTRYPVAEMCEHVGFITWDVVEHDYFSSLGAEGETKSLKDRKVDLAAMFVRHEARPLKNVIQAKSSLAFCRADIKQFTEEVIARDGEGAMVKQIDRPYEFKRSDAVLKVKQFKTADMEIVGAVEGTAGSKYEGMLGALVVSWDGITSEVGSGFDDDTRLELWLRYLRGELLGCIVELQYFEVTPDNSLRLPTFLRERPDKTEGSFN